MTTESGQSGRLLPCLLDAFLEYTSGLPSPLVFRRWAAVSMVAGALERRVWVRVFDSELYPNMFILLVGAPGVGKSMAINPVHQLVVSAGRFVVSPTSVTKAGFIDQLKEKPKVVLFPGEAAPRTMHPLSCFAPEFGTLIPAHDLEFLNTLNDIYDCRNIYEYRLRSSGHVPISYPHLNLLAGTQPKYLASLLPEEAYGMGFTSRMVMVYSANAHKATLFGTIKRDQKLEAMIAHDLRHLSKMIGECQFEPAAADLLEKWHVKGCEPVPDHVKLQSYVTRRIIHLIKLALTISVARSSSMMISLGDVKEAMEMLVDAEAVMPEIFKEMSTQSDSEAIEELYNWMFKLHNAKGKMIKEHLIINKLRTMVPTWKIDYILNTMMKAEMLDWSGETPGRRLFMPKPKHEFNEE